MSKSKAYLKDGVYVPEHKIKKKTLKKHMHIHLFNENGCKIANNGKVCEYRSTRPCDVCQNCPAYHGLFKFYRKGSINNEPFFRIARGREDLIKEIVGPSSKYKVENRRVKNKMTSGLKFTGQLYDYQQDAVDEMLKYKNGLLASLPRTGKTVMFAAMSCKIGLKTLILAHQDDLLVQFKKTFYGAEKDNYLAFTNAQDIEDETEKSPVIIAKKDTDYFCGADVVLSTYQKFISHIGKKRLEDVAKYFGCVLVDEIHKGNATKYAEVLNKVYPEYIYGCSATIERKDGREVIVDRIIGPVRYTTPVKAMTPLVTVHKSALKAKVRAKEWTSILKAICRNTVRNQDIVQRIIKDVEKGHSVVVPAAFRWYCDALCEEINKAWLDKSGSDKLIAEPFYRYPSKAKKEEILQNAISGKTKVVVALRSMLTGINVPRWSMLYEITMINNKPNLRQETERICTPFEGKKPQIRLFVDEPSAMSMRCASSTFRMMKEFGFEIDKKGEVYMQSVRRKLGGGFSNNENEGIGLPGRRISI